MATVYKIFVLKRNNGDKYTWNNNNEIDIYKIKHNDGWSELTWVRVL
jgi:hypothetical protein